VRRTGRSYAHPLVVLFAAPGDGDLTRVGISVSKRVGGAVTRNLLKRRIREIMRRQMSTLQPGWDLLFVVRAEAAAASFDELSGAVLRLLVRSRIAESAGCSAHSS
jgi:ribonuclease P protein component